MTNQYRVIMYNRSTDRAGGIIKVPDALLRDVLVIAGISGTDVSEPGEYELGAKQARDIANLIGFRADVSRFHYHLEQIGPRYTISLAAQIAAPIPQPMKNTT